MILKQGSRGSLVKQLQEKLLEAGFDPKGVDGVFGAGTKEALIIYQISKDLSASGIADEATLESLEVKLYSNVKNKFGWSEVDLREQFDRAQENLLIPIFAEASKKFNHKIERLIAICSRETKIQNILGDGGHGHGLMQIDDRSFRDFCADYSQWHNPRLNILKGASILDSKRLFLSNKGVTEPLLSNGALAAYNTGEGNVWKSIKSGKAIDSTTAGKDYSSDILEREKVFKKFLSL